MDYAVQDEADRLVHNPVMRRCGWRPATALVNALRDAFVGSAMSDTARRRFDAVVDVLEPSDRKRLAAVMRAQPPS